MRYRYFIGIGLPPEINHKISTAQAMLFDARSAIPPLVPHITLLPPPYTEHIPPQELAVSAKAAAKPLLPVHFTLSDVISLGNRRTIAIDVQGHELHALRSALVSLLPVGQSNIRHTFTPHVTLNQAIRGQRLPVDLMDQYREALAPLLPIVCSVSHLTLYRWVKPRVYAAEVLY